MNNAQEIVVKIVILSIILILLIVEVFVIDIRIIQISITVIALILTLVIIIVEVRKGKRKCHAFIYKNKESGVLLFCKNDQGNETRDFVKVGEGTLPCDQVLSLCEFEQ